MPVLLLHFQDRTPPSPKPALLASYCLDFPNAAAFCSSSSAPIFSRSSHTPHQSLQCAQAAAVDH